MEPLTVPSGRICKWRFLIYIWIFLEAPVMWDKLADRSALTPASPVKSRGAALTALITVPIANTLNPIVLGLALQLLLLNTPADRRSAHWPNATRNRSNAN